MIEIAVNGIDWWRFSLQRPSVAEGTLLPEELVIVLPDSLGEQRFKMHSARDCRALAAAFNLMAQELEK